MKSSSLILSSLFVGCIAALILWVAFIWLPEKETDQQEQSKQQTAVSMKSIEEQIRKSSTYTCSQTNGFIECVSGEITFTFEGETGKLYFSFGGHDTTVDCSAYLLINHDIHKTIEEVRRKTRQEHLQAGCISL